MKWVHSDEEYVICAIGHLFPITCNDGFMDVIMASLRLWCSCKYVTILLACQQSTVVVRQATPVAAPGTGHIIISGGTFHRTERQPIERQYK